VQCKHPRRPLWLAGVVVLAALALFPSSSFGYSNAYCGALINQGSWCGDGSNHSYDYNRAEYRGAGDVWVCERLLIADTRTERAGPTCGYDYQAHGYPAYVWLTEAEVTHLYSGGARHTIYGYGVA
jgi:hypothetical protein